MPVIFHVSKPSSVYCTGWGSTPGQCNICRGAGKPACSDIRTCLLLTGQPAGAPTSRSWESDLIANPATTIHQEYVLGSCTGRASARGPARSPWAGPGQASMIFCGPGRVRAWNLQARAWPGLVSNSFAGCGPGLGLTFPGLGRAGPTVKVTLVLT